MVPSKQVDVVGTSGTEDKTVSGRRQSARGTGAAGGPAEDAAPRPKRAGAAAELPSKTKKKKAMYRRGFIEPIEQYGRGRGRGRRVAAGAR